jgi:hypothetical protein
MRERLLEAAEKLDPNDPDTKRGKSMRAEASRQLIRLINELTEHRVTRVPYIERHRREDDELPEMILDAVKAGRELHQEMTEKRKEILDEYDVEIDREAEQGYSVDYDGRTYVVTYPDEIVEVIEDGERMGPTDVEIPEKVQQFTSDYWDAWDKMRSKMLDRMEEIGFQHISGEGRYEYYRVGEYGPRIGVYGTFPREPHRFSIKSKTTNHWTPHRIWDQFDDPAD